MTQVPPYLDHPESFIQAQEPPQPLLKHRFHVMHGKGTVILMPWVFSGRNRLQSRPGASFEQVLAPLVSWRCLLR